MRKGTSCKIFWLILCLAVAGFAVSAGAVDFGIGDTVEVTTNLNVRTGPGTGYSEITDPDYPGYAPEGTTGTILDGPSYANSYTWWEVDYGPGEYSGWSVEDYLKKVNQQTQCWTTGALSNSELANLVKQHFPQGTVSQTGEDIRVTAYAVARAESGGNPTACGDIDVPSTGHLSIGLWQINTYWHPEYDRDQLFDPDDNAEAAKDISNNGADWNPWCTWEETACNGNGNEAYRQWLDEAKEALDVTAAPTITSSLRLIQFSTYYVGDSLTAQFTIKNKGTASITFDVLTVGGRFNDGTLPNGEYPDFTWRRDITLNPGNSYSYQGYLTLTKAGNYHFFCAYRTLDGNWNPAIPTESGVTNVLDITVYSQPECYSDSGCGTDGWTGGPFCSSNDIYQYWRTWTCNNPGQPNAYCSYTDSSQLKQDCGYDSCGSWVNYCESGDVYEERTCHDRGCSNGACYDSSYNENRFVLDCGTSGYTGNDYCYDNDVYRDYVNRGCNYGSCFANTEKIRQQDCGSDYCEDWGSNYCKDGDVWHSRTCHDRGCSNGICYDNTYAEEELVETCQYECENGKCKTEIEGDVNGDCEVNIFDLAAVGLAYSSQPGDGNWNSQADLTGDGKVNIFDLATVGLNYGRSC